MARLVYSSGAGAICPRCGVEEADCRCRSAEDEPVPAKIVAKLRVLRTGRAGKTVTLIDGLPRNGAFLAALARDLKRSCGAGGKSGDGSIELQGDLRERIRRILAARGYAVRG